MELILKKDFENLGFKDDIVVVKNGFGRNYLIPQGIATMATTSARKILAETLKQQAYKESKLIEFATKIANEIKILNIKIIAKTVDGNRLFGSINNSDISAELEKAGQSIDKKNIKIAEISLKNIGKYSAQIRLHRNILIDLPFEIIAEPN